MDAKTWLKLMTGSLLASWIDTTVLAAVDRFSTIYYILIGIDVVLVGVLIFTFALEWAGRVD